MLQEMPIITISKNGKQKHLTIIETGNVIKGSLSLKFEWGEENRVNATRTNNSIKIRKSSISSSFKKAMDSKVPRLCNNRSNKI